MHVQLAGRLARRGNEPLGEHCPIDVAVQAVGTRSAILLLREAYYGATRFDDFAARSGLTEATTAGRLKALVEQGVLEKLPYQEPGQRKRYEYKLTASGEALMPVVFALAQWSNEHQAAAAPIKLSHSGCDAPVTIKAECSEGHAVEMDQLIVTS
ncbi:helix-turn-helix domain-containing protein [Kribbella sp. NPDC051770]|uniref:winged helix-turn-helix transcriptional regulator n=1 Tax=Kribbella sp. NPDC051770 TaxID=3155413 RepID=UPI0034483170